MRQPRSSVADELCSLELYLPQIGYNVWRSSMNMSAISWKASRPGGGTTYDLLSFLCSKAYAIVPDAKFRDCIETKKSEPYPGRSPLYL